jgi:signal transduction histidine kinase
VTDIPEHCVSFVGDARTIRELVTELITNAVKFSTEAGTITCKLTVDLAQAEITISDNGMGILQKHTFRR